MEIVTLAPPTSVDAEPDHSTKPWRPGLWAAAGVGLVTVALAFGVAELLAALGGWLGMFHINASPFNSLGKGFIDLTPEWLKELAIRQFGTHDKDALRAGMVVTLIVLSALLGLLARRTPRLAAGVLIAFVAVTIFAVYASQSGAGPLDWAPAAIGGFWATWFLVARFRRVLIPRLGPERAAPAKGIDRRQFFRASGIGLAVALVAGSVSRLVPSAADVAASIANSHVPTRFDPQPVPAGVDQKVSGQSSFFTANQDFYRVDTAFVVPQVTAEEWQLRIHGMVDKEITLTYQDLLDRPQFQRAITLTCVSNEVGGDLVGNATWIGAHLGDLIKEAGPRAGADCVLCTSKDDFTSSTPLEALTDGRDALLAVAMNGEVLPQQHGFPVRMVVPGLYGYVSATKWVVDLNVTQFSKVTAYWTSRGWDAQAPIKTSSRFDVPRGFANYTQGQQVVLAGVAWAQHRGISAVQVQVDDGEWQAAQLSEPLSNDTWRQWKLPWTAISGQHTLQVRAVDGSGAVQSATQQPPAPNGASGYDSRTVSVT